MAFSTWHHAWYYALALCSTRLVVGVIVDTSDVAEEQMHLSRDRPQVKPQPPADFLVDDSQVTDSVNIGLNYRNSKNLHDEALTYEAYGTVITGSDTGDGWVHVGRLGYLPKQVNGKTVLKKQPEETAEAPPAASPPARPRPASPALEQTYLVDNSHLKSAKEGVIYRHSKNLADTDAESFARYGSRVSGIDEGDGWLRVDGRYLPFQVKGEPILQMITDKVLGPEQQQHHRPAVPAAVAKKASEEVASGYRMAKMALLAPMAVFLVVGIAQLVMDWHKKRQPYRRAKEEKPPTPTSSVKQEIIAEAAKTSNPAPTPAPELRAAAAAAAAAAAPVTTSTMSDADEDDASLQPRASVKAMLNRFEKR